jgi:hypothetical protein
MSLINKVYFRLLWCINAAHHSNVNVFKIQIARQGFVGFNFTSVNRYSPFGTVISNCGPFPGSPVSCIHGYLDNKRSAH